MLSTQRPGGLRGATGLTSRTGARPAPNGPASAGVQGSLRPRPMPRSGSQEALSKGVVNPSAPKKQWASTEEDAEDVVLVADIGGTNCRFELWRLEGEDAGNQRLLYAQTYKTKEHPTFESALDTFAEEEVVRRYPPKSAAFACAGPVINNCCVMTNLSWTIDGHRLTEEYGIRMAVLNDFEACGYGIPALPPEDLITLNDAPAQPKGPKAVLGPGTGLGEAQLFYDENFGDYKVWPSEGSHASFAPRGWKQRALQTYIERTLGHCEYEHVACGSGLERIYEFLRTDEPYNRPEVDFKDAELDAPTISKRALERSCPLCIEAVDLFLAIIGAEAGHMALRQLATGGVYICGGITPKLIERARNGSTLEAFLHEQSRFHKLLRTFPLYIVNNEALGLIGTRQYAAKLLLEPELCDKV